MFSSAGSSGHPHYTETLLLAATRLGHLGAWAYDVATAQLLWSDEVRVIHEAEPGYTPDLEAGINFYHPDSRPRLRQAFRDCLDNGHAFDEEFDLLTARGQLRRVRTIGQAIRNAGGEIIRIEGAFQDITEQYERSRQLAESQATLAAIFSQSYVYQGILDSAGRLSMANQIAFNACGYNEAEEIGKPFWECSWWNRDPSVMAAVRAMIEAALSGTRGVADLDYFVAGGERRQTHFSAVPIQAGEGRALQVLVSGMDITAHQRSRAFQIDLRHVLEQIAAHQPLADNLHAILQLIETQFPQKRASINLLSSDRTCLAEGYSLRLPPEYMQCLPGLPIGPCNGSCGTAAFRGEAVVVEDISTDPLWAEYRSLVAPFGLQSCWSLPIFDTQRKVIGTFAIYDVRPSTPGPGELELVADCAHIAGIAVQRAETEAQLHLLETCIERLNDVVMITEAAPLSLPGPRMIYVNDAFTRLTGYTRAEALGQTPRILQGPHTQRGELERIKAAIAERKPVRAELLNYAKDGHEYWIELEVVPIVDAAGQLRQLVAIERDISERKQQELTLKESQERFQHIARATNDTIWDWDLRDDTVWWNDGMTRLFGYAPDELEANSASWTRRIHPDDVARVEASIHNFIEQASAGETWIDEYRFRRADGRYLTVVDRAFIVRDAEGRGTRMVGGMLDVTPQRTAEAELSRLNRALQMLSACNERLIRSDDEDALLKNICAICVDRGGYKMAWVGYRQEDANKTIRPVANFGDGSYLQDLTLSWSADQPSGRGPGGYCIRESRPMVIEDVACDPSFAPWMSTALAYGYHCVICLPLRDGNRTFGLLGLYAGEPRHISEDELGLLQEMADDLAFGILTIRSRREQQRLQAALLKIAITVTLRSGKSFFRDLLQSAVATLQADAGMIALLDPEQRERVVPLCTLVDGQPFPDTPFPIHETPCQDSLTTEGKLIKSDLREHYPAASFMLSLEAEAYVGLPLLRSDGRPIGLMFVLFRHAIRDDDFTFSTLKIFAARTAAELERQQAESKLREQASLLDKAHDAIVVRDLQHRILFWNHGAERLYGWSAAEAIGQPINQLLYKDSALFEEGTRKVIEHGEWVGEVLHLDKNGCEIWVEAHWSLVHDDDGNPSSILAINTDISQRKASEAEIYTLAFHDSLTRLPNRQLLHNRLQQVLLSAARSHDNGAILFLDLDNFKSLNDTQGHATGDKLLVQVAQRLLHCVRESDTVARIGGDEFVVMLTSLGGQRAEAATQAQTVAEKIIATFAQPFDLDGFEYTSTPSIGVALFSDTQLSVEELLKRADLAMYQAKAAGRNTIRFFDPEMQAAVSLRVQMESDLRRALQKEEFVLYYQAQVDADGCLTGAEALVRWQHPQHGLMSPFNFIPVAEDSGLILPIGVWILQTACNQLATWAREPGREVLSIAVNVSARQFRHPDFVNQVREALARSGANPERLKLELTESQLVDNVEETIDKMHALRSLGVNFSLDDFGTGYSSLYYLKRLPLAQLKIDPSFVRDILDNPSDAAIARTVIALGHSLGLNVIAEGVETEAQRNLLDQLGCHFYQGYLFSRPLPIHEFNALKLVSASMVRR